MNWKRTNIATMCDEQMNQARKISRQEKTGNITGETKKEKRTWITERMTETKKVEITKRMPNKVTALNGYYLCWHP